MRHLFKMLCPEYSLGVWLAMTVLAASTLAQDQIVEPQIIGDSIRIAKPPQQTGRLSTISDGISIARPFRTQFRLVQEQQVPLDSRGSEKPESALPPVPTDEQDSESERPFDAEIFHRRISDITLAEATRPDSLKGEQLRRPDDDATEIFAGFGMLYDIAGYQGVLSPVRNRHPIWFNPLYFEDPNLERCGNGHGCLTEFVSAARFFGRIPGGPYLMATNPPCSCVRSLGDCPTCCEFGHDAYIPPINAHGVGVQAAATVGLIFLIP